MVLTVCLMVTIFINICVTTQLYGEVNPAALALQKAQSPVSTAEQQVWGWPTHSRIIIWVEFNVVNAVLSQWCRFSAGLFLSYKLQSHINCCQSEQKHFGTKLSILIHIYLQLAFSLTYLMMFVWYLSTLKFSYLVFIKCKQMKTTSILTPK